MKRANPSQPPATGKERTMNGTSGRTSGMQFAYYDPDTCSWRMWPAIGLWGSVTYSETWPTSGYMSGGQAYELPTSEHHTTVSASLSLPHLPTPAASDSLRRCTPSEAKRKSPTMVAVRVHFPEFIAELTGESTPLSLDVGSE